MSVVPFDEPVGLRHLPADGRERCLRGVPVTELALRDDPRFGSLLRVHGCLLDRGHGGECVPDLHPAPRLTVCGLPMHDRPWVPLAAARECPTCFREETR